MVTMQSNTKARLSHSDMCAIISFIITWLWPALALYTALCAQRYLSDTLGEKKAIALRVAFIAENEKKKLQIYKLQTVSMRKGKRKE